MEKEQSELEIEVAIEFSHALETILTEKEMEWHIVSYKTESKMEISHGYKMNSVYTKNNVTLVKWGWFFEIKNTTDNNFPLTDVEYTLYDKDDFIIGLEFRVPHGSLIFGKWVRPPGAVRLKADF